MFTVALFEIGKSWEQSRCSTDEWINKECIPRMEYFLAIKRSELLLQDTTWINKADAKDT